MIPKIIHYSWFGDSPKPELVERCIASWHRFMPNWIYMEWNEHNFDIAAAPLYVRQAYEAHQYAFVSDYVRLWALEQYGGVYMDVDFEVYKSFEPLLDCPEGAFVGREGSKYQPPMLGVMASEAHGEWVKTMKSYYDSRVFIKEDGSYDKTTNVSFFAAQGIHKPEWVHIYPADYFCPVLTTGERIHSPNTYCEHKGLHSWITDDTGIKALVSKMKHWLLEHVSNTCRIRIIKLKRKLIG